MQTFEQRLQAELDAGRIDRRSAFGRRVTRVLNSTNANRKARVLGRMEEHAIVHLGGDPNAELDWSQVKTADWKSIIDLLIKLLPLIMALFGM